MPAQENNRSASSSHMMKTTKRGRPFLKDTLDLFATLIVSLQLDTHKQYFRTFPNSFTTDEAAHNLAQLKFSQSNRAADPRDPQRVVTTTTTTTFTMTRDMAKAMCQHFMDARLIENAADRTSNLFKDRGVYQLTPKGLHVLERFISKNGISADHLLRVFNSQPICLKLLHLERRQTDDEIIISQSVVTALFRRFVGRSPNYMVESSGAPGSSNQQDPNAEYHERSKGIALTNVTERTAGSGAFGRSQVQVWKDCFLAVTALEWLCDFTSIVGRDEAAEMSAHFVRFGLITLVSDKRKGNDSAIIFTVRGSTTGNNTTVAPQGEFRCTSKAIYRITEEGRRVARWESLRAVDSPNSSSLNVSQQRTSVDKKRDDASASTEAFEINKMRDALPENAKLHRRTSILQDKVSESAVEKRTKESNTDRLKWILDEPSLRALFRDFLRGNFCEENLSFWLEVQEFKRKFNTTSSASAAIPGGPSVRNGGPLPPHLTNGNKGGLAMDKHHESLIQKAFEIYNVYLAPSSQCELNIDHGLRNELVSYLSEVMTELTGKTFQGRIDPDAASSISATHLNTMIKLYERIQLHVFRLMATDSVPKFIKTSKFLQIAQSLGGTHAEDDEDWETATERDPSRPPGLEDEDEDDERGRTYMTESQQAYDRAEAYRTQDRVQMLAS